MKHGKLILISGGARSGKSSFAERLAGEMDKQIAYLATAQILDFEMEDRIKNHRLNRPSSWQTFEEPFNICEVIKGNCKTYKTWLLDCITLYISNLLFDRIKSVDSDIFVADSVQDFILEKIENLIMTIRETKINMIAVTNEVGWGIVPGDPLSRAYRDIVGRVNQLLSREAQEVYLVSLGIPIKLKPGSPFVP